VAPNAKPKPSAAARALRRYDDDQLLCRFGNLGHVWEILGYFRSGIAGEVRRTLVCARCGTERTDRWLSGSGERVASSYRYADGYRLDLEGERMAASDVRLEAIRRANVYANEAQMLDHLTGGR
jgi:hypothetical protein